MISDGEIGSVKRGEGVLGEGSIHPRASLRTHCNWAKSQELYDAEDLSLGSTATLLSMLLKLIRL